MTAVSGDRWHEDGHWGAYGAAGLLLRHDGAVLLQRRSAAVDAGGSWSIPGGARRVAERPAQCAIREASEEGVRLDSIRIRDVVETFRSPGGWRFWVVMADGPARLRDTSEGVLRWVPLDEVESLANRHPQFAESWPRLLALTQNLADADAEPSTDNHRL